MERGLAGDQEAEDDGDGQLTSGQNPNLLGSEVSGHYLRQAKYRVNKLKTGEMFEIKMSAILPGK